MATAYKIAQFTVTQANTSQQAFAASASNTVISSIICTDSNGATVTLSVKKGTTSMQIVNQALTSNESVDLLVSPIALESTDKIMVTSTRPSGSNFVISYVEDTNSVSGQAIGVLSDVPNSIGTSGQVLAVNSGATSLEYVDQSGGASELNELSDVSTSGVSNGDVLVANSSGDFSASGSLQELTTLLKSGSSTTLTADGSGTSTDEGRLDLTATEGKVKFATDSEMTLTSTTARLKTGVTEVKMTETSPGEIDFIVAAGASGSETAFTAAEINGTATANTALFDVKTGTRFRIESSTNDLAFIRNQASADTIIDLPTSSGTLARTADIAADSAVVANTAKTSFPGFGTSAGTALEGDTTTISTAQANAITANTAKNSYPSADATKLAGIETGADVTDTTNVAAAGALMDSEVTNLAQVKAFDSSDYATAAQGSTADSALQDVIDDTSPELGGDLDVKAQKITTSTSNGNIELDPNGTGLVQVNGDTNPGAIKLMCEAGSHGVTIQSPDHAEQADYTLTLPTTNGSSNQVLKTDGNGVLSWTNQATGGGSPTAYDYDAFTTSANVTMNADVSVASNKIVDIMGDALAAKNNANAKKFLGFHTGSGVCVLQGMVNASGSISGASAGSPLWLGASGAFSATAPDTADEYSRIVGYFVASLQGGQVMCYFNPSQDWVQIDS